MACIFTLARGRPQSPAATLFNFSQYQIVHAIPASHRYVLSRYQLMKPTRPARHGQHLLAPLLVASLLPSLTLVGQAASVAGTITYTGDQPGPVRVQAVQTLPGNQVLALDGDGDFASTTLTDLSGPEITIQYWFRGSSLQSAVRQQSGGYLVAGWNNRHILSHDGATTGISAGERLTDGQWHHLVMTWKQGTAGGFASYLDGQLVEQRDSADTPIPNHDAQVYFGSFNGTGEFAQGQFDEIALWRRALTPAEVTAQWNRRLTGNEPDLIGYWNFDDGTPNDTSPNLYHAELWGDALIEPANIPGLGGGLANLRLDAPGPYELSGLPDGPGYTVIAFRDVNDNGHRDPTEPFGAFAGNPFTLAGTQTGVDVVLVEVPRITLQPRSQRTGVGETVSFTVEAAGSAPLAFEWRKDNLPLTEGGRVAGSRTATLTLTGVQPTDAGVYSVVVSNTPGSTTSDPASLEVVAGGVSIAGEITYAGAQTGPLLVTAGQRRVGNQVLKLDGNGDFAITPAIDVSGAELTVQYWFRGSVSQSAVRQQSGGWIVSTWNGLHILSNDGGVNGISAGPNLTDGQWHHVALTWTQGTPGGFASYLDGKLVAQRDSSATPIPNHNAPFYFGAFGGSGEFATGELDEISIWRRALSGPEIAAGQRSSLTGNEEGLAGYWNFDDGTGTDLSPNDNHAELNGDAAIVPADIAAMGSAYTEAIANPGPYVIAHIPPGNDFHVTAFRDVNGNGLLDASEPVGSYAGNPFNLTAHRTGVDVLLYDPPVILVHPAGRAVAAGSTVAFQVTAAGTSPLSYQWRKDGVDVSDGAGISGSQTATLTLTGVTSAHEGNYRVVVTNPAASVTSAGATLVLAASITDRLIGHWRFDETSGLTAQNSVTGGAVAPDGELTNYAGDDSQWVSGQIGGALNFGGPSVSEWVWIPDYPKPDRVMSLSAWVWAESLPSWASIAKNWGDPSSTGQFHFGANESAGDLSNYITQSGGSVVSARTQQPLPTGKWEHVAFVCDGGTLRVYQNGLQAAAATYDGTLINPPAMASLALGVKTRDDGVTPAFGYWHGKMDDVGFWQRPLTPAEVQGIYTAGLAGRDLTQATAAPAEVRVSIVYQNGRITVSWPAEATGWTLQSADALGAAPWQTVPGVTGSSITLPATGTARFFRLAQ